MLCVLFNHRAHKNSLTQQASGRQNELGKFAPFFLDAVRVRVCVFHSTRNAPHQHTGERFSSRSPASARWLTLGTSSKCCARLRARRVQRCSSSCSVRLDTRTDARTKAAGLRPSHTEGRSRNRSRRLAHRRTQAAAELTLSSSQRVRHTEDYRRSSMGLELGVIIIIVRA